MNLPTDMYERLDGIKSEIVAPCELCGGQGYVMDDEEIEACRCMKVFEYVMSLVISHIPQDYWNLKLNGLDVDDRYKALVEFYVENMEAAERNGLGILFLGANGIGKTTLMCEIGKAAVARGATVQYFTAQQFVDSKPNSDWLYKQFESSKYVLLDEIDKVYIKSGSRYALKALEEFIRRSISNRKCVVICSNLDRDQFSKTFGDSVMSMIKRHLRVVDVVGDDYSDSLHDAWQDKMLESVYDYFADDIVEKAEEFSKQERGGYLV